MHDLGATMTMKRPGSNEGSSADTHAVGQPGNASPSRLTPFRAITTTRSYEGVVQQIEAAVRTGQIKRGERLPTERELSASFDVSRGVVREAIKVLGAMGLVEARQGSGLYVQNDTIPTVTRAFTLSVSPDAESIDRLFEFRRSLESESARYAALRRSRQHLKAMYDAIEVIAQASDPLDWEGFGRADTDFHAAVASASGNPYLEVAVATARDMQRDVVHLIADRAGSIRSAMSHHRSILEAIREQDPEQASRLMADHVDYTAAVVQSLIPNEFSSAATTSDSSDSNEGAR
jgi:GntR family transcriptional regulator, transcriptional repressor for pyruvate dehydrogenase complex